MKKLLIILFAVSSTTAFSQSYQEEIDIFQSVFGMEKKEVVAELIKIDDAKSQQFWSLYDEYEVERKALGKKRIELLQKYADEYEDISADQIDELVTETMSQTAANEKLIKSYYKKIKKEIGIVTAAQFYQWETYLHSEIRVAILGNIPMVEKIKK